MGCLTAPKRRNTTRPCRGKHPGHKTEEAVMPRNIAIGLGLMEFPFSSVEGFWRWADLCEAGGVDSLWQTDRIVSREPILESMSVMAAVAGGNPRPKIGVEG